MTETEFSFPASPSSSPLENELSLERLLKFTGLQLRSSWNEEKSDEKLAHKIPDILIKLCHPHVGLSHFSYEKQSALQRKSNTITNIEPALLTGDARSATLPPPPLPCPTPGFHNCAVDDHLGSQPHPPVLSNLIFSSVFFELTLHFPKNNNENLNAENKRWPQYVNFFLSSLV